MRRLLVLLVILALAAIEPLTHYWIMYHPPEGSVPTGMHIGDSAHHLLCMRSFGNGFHSPFALCNSGKGPQDWRNFAAPFFLLYGCAGALGRLLNVNEFIFLGLLNGFGGALLLWMAYRLFRAVIPKHAETAFFLFALGGGLGGVLFTGAAAFGVHRAPGFELYFSRYAWCELIEGQHFSPVLLMPRFYYSFPLALGLGALAALIRGGRRDLYLIAPGLLFAASFINARLGPMFWLAYALYLMDAPGISWKERIRRAVWAGVFAGLGIAAAWGVLRNNPAYTANVAQVTQQVLRLLPYLSATVFLWIAMAPGIIRGLNALPPLLRHAAAALAGYLLAYGALFAAFQAYYGNWFYGGDTAAAAAVSDPAWLGAAAGILAARWWKPAEEERRKDDAPALGWVVLWLLLFLAAALSAWGHGWFMRFSPQRFSVLLGPPMAILAAAGIARMRPKIRRVLFTVILVCGFFSISVAAAWFQGPLGHVPGLGPFAYLHYETMTPADADLLRRLPGGTVAAPGWSPIAFGEIISLREGVQVVGGPGAMNLGGQPFSPLQTDIERFFAPESGDDIRREFVLRYCVDYVYCPDTCPVNSETMRAFRAAPWLKLVTESGRGALFEVRRNAMPSS